MNLALIIIHVVISVLLVAVVLMQHGKQQGMSGAIAGGAETFFGKNKGRTIDAMLKKFTAVLAILFVISSVVLTAVSVNQHKADSSEDVQTEASETVDGTDATQQLTLDEEGNLVDADGNIVMTKEEVEQSTAEAEAVAAEDETADDEAMAEAVEEVADETANAADSETDDAE